MKGIVCEEIGRLRHNELPEPAAAPGDAIVRIRRIGICGTDMHAYRGNQPYFTYPRVLGHELAGVIEAIGDNDEGFTAGDQVSIIPYMHCGTCIACRGGKTNCCTSMKVLGVHVDGGMCEWIAVPVSHLVRTDGLTLDQAAVLEPLAIGEHAVRRSELRGGETALVIGAGPIGLAVMASAKQRGARVVAMDINDERLAYCREWAGIDAVVNARSGAQEQVAALTGGDYPTVVFDATGNAQSMADAFGLVAHGGKLVFVGLFKGIVTFDDPEFHKREMTLMSSRNATKEDFASVVAAMRSGCVDADRYITHRAPFADTVERFEAWLKPEAKVIKAMVEL